MLVMVLSRIMTYNLFTMKLDPKIVSVYCSNFRDNRFHCPTTLYIKALSKIILFILRISWKGRVKNHVNYFGKVQVVIPLRHSLVRTYQVDIKDD